MTEPRGLSRWAAVVTLVALGAALFMVAAPAHALPPVTANFFNPDDTFTTPATRLGTTLSDRADGANSTAHLTVVADTTASSVDFYYCPPAFTAGQDPTAPANGCTLIGTDSTGVQPTSGADEAYDFDWAIPTAAQGTFDVVGWVCTGLPKDTTNCSSIVEDSIVIEDADEGPAGSQTSAGEITSPAHGTTVSNAGFTATATTSNDVTEVSFCVDTPADALTAPAGCDSTVVDITPDATTGTSKTWSGTFSDVQVPDATEFEVALIESTGGQGNCAGDAVDCQLDAHYVVSSSVVISKAVVHFPEEAGSTCTAPDISATNTPDQSENVRGCLFDQSNNLVTGNFAFEISPRDPAAITADAGGFTGADALNDEGTETDANLDGFFESVKGTAANMGEDVPITEANQEIAGLETAGTYTITFCFDSDNDGDCDDEAAGVRATATKIVTAGPPTHTHVLRSSDVTANPSCHVGPTTVSAPAGSPLDVTGCAKDANENGTPSTRVAWSLSGTGSFSGTPENTTDSAGQADAVVIAPASAQGQSATITFGLDLDNNGIPDAGTTSTLQVSWGAPTPGNKCPGASTLPGNHIVGTSSSETLNGTNGNDVICGLGGNDTINGLGGDDVILGGDGNDTIRGGTGDDLIFGQAGNDLIFGNEGNDRISGGDGDDRIAGGSGNDKAWGVGGADRLYGQDGNDRLVGNAGDDPIISGGAGDDVLVGSAGNDGLVGGLGSDTGYGLSGNDRLYFRDGIRDVRVDGGTGVDVCSRDAIDPVDECP